jgi:hypothetical protein
MSGTSYIDTKVTSVSDDIKNSRNDTSVSVDCSGGDICIRCSDGSCSTFPNMYVTGAPSNVSNTRPILGAIILIIVLFILIGVCFYFRKRIMDLFKRR